MVEHFDYKKEWEKTKKQLLKFGQEASILAKKGEEELIKFSQRSKLQVDVTATHLKIEKLYYSIGKEYVKSKNRKAPSVGLEKLLSELDTLLKEEKALKLKLNKKNVSKTTANQTVRKNVQNNSD